MVTHHAFGPDSEVKPAEVVTVYQWRVSEKDKRGRDRWRTLRWRMTIEEAMAWSAANMKAVEMVPGSAENRTNLQGDGVGQHVPHSPGRSR